MARDTFLDFSAHTIFLSLSYFFIILMTDTTQKIYGSVFVQFAYRPDGNSFQLS